MKKILIINTFFYPGFKGGGPIQSCENIITNLNLEFEFYVLCSDRDLNDTMPYENIKINEWIKEKNYYAYYMGPEKQNIKGFKNIFKTKKFDLIYLNGFFEKKFTLIPLLIKKSILKNTPIILSPRGHLCDGCYNHKHFKKSIYLKITKLFGLYKDIIWHSTSDLETNDIKSKIKDAKIYTIPNLSQKYIENDNIKKKESGKLSLVFISRIAARKNLYFALLVLSLITEGEINFDIYGPIEDTDYYQKCAELITKLPKNIKVKYCGEIEHGKVKDTFNKYHAFFFPTLGENYGHVIVEAMMNNCLSILSKNVTPWDEYIDLISLGGNLDDIESFRISINKLLYYDQNEFNKVIKKNNDFVKKMFSNDKIINEYFKMFNMKDYDL